MYKKILLVSALSIIFLKQSLAADDVYVDLSVLDEIPQNSIGFVSSQPLFPIIKNTKPVAPKTVRKTITKTIKNLKKPEPVKPEISPNKEENTTQMDVFQKTTEKEQETKEVENQPQITEEPAKIIENSNAETKDEAIITPEAEIKTNQTSEESETKIDQTEKEEIKKDTSPTSVEALDEKKVEEPQVLSATISDRKIIEQSSAVKLKEVYAITFEKDMTELSSEALKTLDVIIQSFDKNNKKKISIKAYNSEDGKDSFRKKRISLNRATEVRSYLLSHGFKNFSIKIINTTADNEYKDTVEIEEIN